MKHKSYIPLLMLLLFLFYGLSIASGLTEKTREKYDIDERVKNFLESQRYNWHDENVPEADGKLLYNLIIKHNYRKALEIGTSTGRSAIWMAWALSKTDGKLITIEINERRYNKAIENFKRAGLSEYIDARLADAHELVPELDGPFDFVFVDADKNWYKNYLRLLLPKLEAGGCFTAHNVLNLKYMQGVEEFLAYAKSLPNIKTTIERASWAGISVSYKKDG